ncbi:MAG: hypothetical protein ABJ379_08475 [Roseibium sp.]|uniref:hypothetical protein n=1 Tax=Roseibium sp. TaxID=1936156 RepID=UPI003297803C
MKLPDPEARRHSACMRRTKAAKQSTAMPFDTHPDNGEDVPYIFNFRKGLKHDKNGLVDPGDYEKFRDGLLEHHPETFADAPLVTMYAEDDLDGGHVPKPPATDACGNPMTFDKLFRQWESPTGGFSYVLQGPDALAIATPRAPDAQSAELVAEMAEVYQMALDRDLPVAAYMDKSLIDELAASMTAAARKRINDDHAKVQGSADLLSRFRWFKGHAAPTDEKLQERRRRRRFGTPQEPKNLYRGEGEDPWPTPFLSQFMVMGTGGSCPGDARTEPRKSGQIVYGAQRIDQAVRIATPGRDYMTAWKDWRNVQNAYDARGVLRALAAKAKADGQSVQDQQKVSEDLLSATGAAQFRPLTRLRDLATYVHDDQLYQAYLNAALIMLAEGHAYDPGIPYHGNTANGAGGSGGNREPFAVFGGPHLLTLVTEVSSRALRAVRASKFQVHRRLRPEALGALFHTVLSGYKPSGETETDGAGNQVPVEIPHGHKARSTLGGTVARYLFPNGMGTEPALSDLLTKVREHNKEINKDLQSPGNAPSWLLPMAFPEGSPMHPAYGAGHATVAGACVTLLKAFFAMRDKDDPAKPTYVVPPGGDAIVPDPGVSMDDVTIDLRTLKIEQGLTLEGELNKLCWNISNGRNIAGVHYYTDYIESALLGEAITLGILREQMTCYDDAENVSMTVPLFTRRTLPLALLTEGKGVQEGDEVTAVKIDRDGVLHAVTLAPRIAPDEPDPAGKPRPGTLNRAT